MTMRRRLATTLIASLMVSASLGWGQSESVSYGLQQSTVDASGGSCASTGYVQDASLGQELVVATSASVHYVVQSGFWGFLGSGLAPVILDVTNSPGPPQQPVLTWTGNGADYSIYRSIDCADVFAGFLAAESGHTYTDATPPGATLACYNVLAEPAVLLRRQRPPSSD